MNLHTCQSPLQGCKMQWWITATFQSINVGVMLNEELQQKQTSVTNSMTQHTHPNTFNVTLGWGHMQRCVSAIICFVDIRLCIQQLSSTLQEAFMCCQKKRCAPLSVDTIQFCPSQHHKFHCFGVISLSSINQAHGKVKGLSLSESLLVSLSLQQLFNLCWVKTWTGI